MSTELMPFLFEGERLVRVVLQDGEPWFVAADVCGAIGIKNPTMAVEPLDDDEKGLSSTETLRGHQEVVIVSEGGLYTIVLRSRAATTPGSVAHRFRKWVTGEVLPSIRKTGSYHATETPALPIPERRPFPDWPLEELRAKKSAVDMYRMNWGLAAAQWIAPQLGFPSPPPELIEHARQYTMSFTFGSEGEAHAN